MSKLTRIRIATALGTAAALTLAAPLAAQAHVSVDPSSTAASGFSILSFSVGHGCEGSPTTALTFTVPESIVSVTPTVNPGWAITTTDNTVTYTAGTPLPDHHRTTFELSVKLPDGVGEQLAFPVLQECEVGSTDWSEVAAAGEEESDSPAPMLTLTDSTGEGHDSPVASEVGDSADAEEAPVTEEAAGTSATEDTLARALGIGGLVLGVVGIIFGVTSRRAGAAKALK